MSREKAIDVEAWMFRFKNGLYWTNLLFKKPVFTTGPRGEWVRVRVTEIPKRGKKGKAKR